MYNVGDILRYVRINTLKVKLEDALDELRVMGFKLVTDLKVCNTHIHLIAFMSSYIYMYMYIIL